MVRFSLIIPIYNKAKYLRATLDSVVRIKNTEFEVLLVDDGSVDESSAICDSYSKEYSFIHAYHIENGGVTNARKYGVQKAIGDWIGFIDADDTVEPNYLDVLGIGNIENECDIVVAGQEKTGFVDFKKAFWLFVDGKLASVHQKLFRKELFSDYVFDMPRTITRGEDMIMNIHLAYASKRKVMFLHENIYNYEMRQDGLYSSTKYSIEALELWYKCYMNSLSSDILKEHEFDFLLGRMANLYDIALSNPIQLKWKKSKFYKELQDWRSENKNIRIPLKYKSLFFKNNLVLIMFLILFKIRNRIK